MCSDVHMGGGLGSLKRRCHALPASRGSMKVEPMLQASSLQREGVGRALQGGDRKLLEMERTPETER